MMIRMIVTIVSLTRLLFDAFERICREWSRSGYISLKAVRFW